MSRIQRERRKAKQREVSTTASTLYELGRSAREVLQLAIDTNVKITCPRCDGSGHDPITGTAWSTKTQRDEPMGCAFCQWAGDNPEPGTMAPGVAVRWLARIATRQHLGTEPATRAFDALWLKANRGDPTPTVQYASPIFIGGPLTNPIHIPSVLGDTDEEDDDTQG